MRLFLVGRNRAQVFVSPKASIMSSSFVVAALIAGALLIAAAVYIILLSRHHKAATGEFELIGAQASVETTLEPEGAVLVRGELWRARSRAGTTVGRGCRVRIVGASAHLLEVEPLA
jgi:membrane-bound serine protease (ClpP class)